MVFVVGTTSSRKIQTVKKVLADILETTDFTVIPFAAQSQVSETPYDEQTYLGAKNRALAGKTAHSEADYFIGIESGLVERYGQIYEEAWCCLLTSDEREYTGYSSGLKVPNYILQKMKEHNLPHYLIFAKLHNHTDKEINSDTWGVYTAKKLMRELSLAEAVRNTLVQAFASEESYYNK